MSHHSHDTSSTGKDSNPLHLAIAIAVGAVGLIVGIYLLAQFAIGTRAIGTGDAKANSPEAVAKRIAPVVNLAVDPSKGPVPVLATAAAPAPGKAAAAPIVAMAIPAAVPAGTAAAKPAGGKGVFDATCTACHGAGIAGAPKAGDKAAWGPRIAKGSATLYEHALKGFNTMPAKGGNATVADADVKAAVDYMISMSK
ncbi:MAG: cytochrome c5 family protein [Betaproteobacteria bacterium]|nr:cytochrome c5 family protein [Betaproteobacteria bacterium]